MLIRGVIVHIERLVFSRILVDTIIGHVQGSIKDSVEACVMKYL
jgi:hypothetical protein